MSRQANKARRAMRRGLPDPRKPWLPTRRIDAAIRDAAEGLRRGSKLPDVHQGLVDMGAAPTQAHHITQAALQLATWGSRR